MYEKMLLLWNLSLRVLLFSADWFEECYYFCHYRLYHHRLYCSSNAADDDDDDDDDDVLDLRALTGHLPSS